jgi:predicted transcriptional regulator
MIDQREINRRNKPERRSKASILRDILRAIQNKGGRSRPTHILYAANLSHDRLKKYLDSLAVNGFIKKETDGNETFYEITQKGLEFLSGFNKMKRFFDAFGVEI